MVDMNELQIDEFGEYLLRQSFCKEGNIKFYLFWVKRFFRDSREWPPDSWDVLLQQFVNELHDDPHVEVWQVEQADRAVRLYFHNFRSGDGLEDAKESRVTIEPGGQVVSVDLISAVRQSLRIQHYSYRNFSISP